MPHRPLGLWILPTYQAALGLAGMVASFFSLVLVDTFTEVLLGITPTASATDYLDADRQLLISYQSFIFFWSCAALVSAFGLWGLRGWARWLCIGLYGSNIAIVLTQITQNEGYLGYGLVRIAVSGLIVFYLTRSKVRMAFCAMAKK